MAYIEILSASEDDFRETVREIEADPLFRELRSMGVVRRRGGRGRMPAEAYERRLDAEVSAFLDKHGLADEPDALEKIREGLAEHGAKVVAKRLRAPIAEVRQLERFLTEPPRDEPSARRASRDGVAPDLDDFVAASPSIDISEATATVRDFVERYSIAEHQLVADFLHSQDSPQALARRYRTTPEAIERVVDAVNYVLTADILEVPIPSGRSRSGGKSESAPIVARVYLHDGEPFVHFGEDTGYGLRYVIEPGALSEIDGGESRERAEELVTVLRHVNQRRSVQCRVVAALCEKQKAYFREGDELELRPVSQADLARELKEHQSTISRAVRGRYMETPYGTHELQFYCQRKRDVVLRLSAANSEMSDRELQEVLLEKYDCDIARRTVAYHRRAHRK